MKDLLIGSSGEATVIVADTNTALAMGSGSLEVFATPAMCALMEKAAVIAVEPCLEDGETTVGIALSISHQAPSALGAHIRAKATVEALEGKKISFTVEAYDGDISIGKGKHERFVVQGDRFMSKLKDRK